MWEYVKKRGGDRLIRKILIANNGMAATKTIMSIRNWAYNTFGDERAVQFVVMATPDDLNANAEFIRRADEFVEVPGGSNANNYANVQLIVDLCLSQDVRAVPPSAPLAPVLPHQRGVRCAALPCPRPRLHAPALFLQVDAVMVGWGHASENPKLGDMLKVRGCARARHLNPRPATNTAPRPLRAARRRRRRRSARR